MLQDFYSGIREVKINNDDEQLAKIYQNMYIQTETPLIQNEYVILKDENGLVIDKFRWNGENLQKLRTKNINNNIVGKIKSLNVYQDCIIDMILDNSLTVKSCTGIPGGGKTFLPIVYAIDKILKNEFNKLVYIKNHLDIAHEKLGAIPGSLEEKVEPWIRVLYDVLGDKYIVEKLKTEDKLEIVYLGHTVGRTFANKSFVLVDDSQQLSKEHIYNLTSRLGYDSVLFLAGDIFQSYSNKYKNGNSGIRFLHEQLKGEKFFACVHTKISERSYTAQRCAELLFEGLIS